MNLIIRNITDSTASNIRQEAERQNISRQEMLSRLIEERYGSPPVVVGWLKLDRWGELDQREEQDNPLAICPECGEGVDPADAWLAVIADGRVLGPYCGECATSQ